LFSPFSPVSFCIATAKTKLRVAKKLGRSVKRASYGAAAGRASHEFLRIRALADDGMRFVAAFGCVQARPRDTHQRFGVNEPAHYRGRRSRISARSSSEEQIARDYQP